jgi:hypothetical protein
MVTVTHDMLGCPAVPVFLRLKAAGVRFRLDGDQVLVSPRGALTPEQRDVFRQHQEAVRALVAIVTDVGVQERRNAFVQQLAATQAPGVPAFLFQAGVPYTRGTCFSCGDRLPEARFGRCSRCSLAWRLAARVPIDVDLAAALDAARVCA